MTAGEEQWVIVQNNFDVDEVVNYFAASMALSNWDGFSDNSFVPPINQLGERLKPEVQFRATLSGQDPESALQGLDQRLQRLRDHVKKRRAFLLASDELKKP